MPKYCNNCGTELKDNSVFCENCGQRTNLSNDTEETGTNNIDSLRNKANALPEKQPKKGKKVLIAILSILVVLSFGVLAGVYFLYDGPEPPKDQLKKPDSSITMSEEESSINDSSSITESKEEESSVTESEAEPNDTWEIRETTLPANSLETIEVDVNGQKIIKYKTGIEIDHNSFSEYFKDTYQSENTNIIETKDETIYTRKSSDKNYYGVKDIHDISVIEDKEEITKASFSTYSAVFEGADSLSVEITGDGSNLAVFQTECFNRLSVFLPETAANWLVYGSVSEDADPYNMTYEITLDNPNIKASYIRTVSKNTNESIKAVFVVKYELLSDESAQNPFFDTTEGYVYDNAATKISDIFMGTHSTDYKMSHNFLKDVLSNLTVDNKKFIDTKIESINIKETSDGEKTNDVYTFRVMTGLSDTKYTESPYIDCEISVEKDGSDYTGISFTINGDFQNNKDLKNISKSITDTMYSMFPSIPQDTITYEDIYKKLKSGETYESDITTVLTGNSINMGISVENVDSVIFSISGNLIINNDSSEADSSETDSTDNSDSLATSIIDDDYPQTTTSEESSKE